VLYLSNIDVYLCVYELCWMLTEVPQELFEGIVATQEECRKMIARKDEVIKELHTELAVRAVSMFLSEVYVDA